MPASTTASPVLASQHPALGTRTAVYGVMVLFGVNGLAIGGWGGNLPSLVEKLHLSTMQISLMLILSGLAGIAAMQLAGRLADRIGARTLSLAALPLLIAAAFVAAFAPSYPVVLVAGLLIGAGNGGMDVSMNAVAVQVEKARGSAIMSFFHGFWSIGQFIGALSVLAISYTTGLRGAPAVAPVMLTLAGLCLVGLAVAWFLTPVTERVAQHDAHGVRVKIPRAAYLLGIMAIAFGLGEGTAMDWSGIHMRDVAGVDASTAAAGLAAVSGFMVVIRLVGDALVNRFGRRAVVRFGGVCAGLGYFITAVASPFWVLMVGWSLVGLGVGMIAPQVYAVAGHTAGGRGLAVVVTFGYAAFLCGPAVVGFLRAHIGIQHTMFVPAALMLGLLLVARVMPAQDADLRAEQ